MDRLFNLDAQLLFDTAVTAFNIFILFIFLSYMLSNPVRKLLTDRQERIKNDLEGAAKDRTDALEMKKEYEAKLKDVRQEAELILADARKRASANEARIVQEADAEAERIRSRARAEIELEKKKAADDMKTQIIEVASQMAGKVVASTVNLSMQDALVKQTLEEMGDQIWQS